MEKKNWIFIIYVKSGALKMKTNYYAELVWSETKDVLIYNKIITKYYKI